MRATGALASAFLAFATLAAQSDAPALRPFDGFDVIAANGFPFGDAPARRALAEAKAIGARAIAVIPFLWQSKPDSPDLGRGRDMTDAALRSAIRDAHALGLSVMVKPQVWVPESWAGAVAMTSNSDWQTWFANYRREIDRIAGIANDEKAEALALGTELAKTTGQSQWSDLIDRARDHYAGRLLYVAHNVEEAEAITFWERLDLIGVTLYPPLGADNDRAGRISIMRTAVDRLDALAKRTGKPLLVAEIGLRSAVGAAAKPWESAEERDAAPDPALQAQVLADWLTVLDRPSIRGVMIWRWFTNPVAGGLRDTDFTVQGKPAERILFCAFTRSCNFN